jgi:medium-chain acyl-[acyl-carrier-protein] hydrolase
VETWPKDVDGLLYLRDFIIRDSSKNCVAKATSGWLAIDLDTRRPKKIEGINASILDFLKSKHAIESAPDKLPPTSEGKQFEKQIAYFDIDLNRHVTATRYVDWMMDSLPVDFLMSHYPTKLSINYMKETKLGDTILLNSTQPVENQIRFEGINKGTDHSSFRGMIEFYQAEK